MPRTKIVGLTKRQHEIVRLRLQGYTYRQVAAILGISYHTVKSRLQDAYFKLDVHNLGELYIKMSEQEAS